MESVELVEKGSPKFNQLQQLYGFQTTTVTTTTIITQQQFYQGGGFYPTMPGQQPMPGPPQVPPQLPVPNVQQVDGLMRIR